MTEKKISFEESLQEVQEIITRIEEGKLPLEDSVKQFEEGMKTLAALDEELKKMNRRLTVLQDGKEQELTVPGDLHEDV
ncbi:MAG: exodeoxyribonuclease VII small subunit [Clostridia bacterium]|nr:exodeoxyribonuclease VII small subunit [Clostridia bacterium]